jgi:glutamine synthetase
MGFENEKDHPEVAPSQFEINYGYGEVVAAADQIQLYKLICRQVATRMGLTASRSCPSRWSASTATACTPTFPSARAGRIFLGSQGRRKAEQAGWSFVDAF